MILCVRYCEICYHAVLTSHPLWGRSRSVARVAAHKLLRLAAQICSASADGRKGPTSEGKSIRLIIHKFTVKTQNPILRRTR